MKPYREAILAAASVALIIVLLSLIQPALVTSAQAPGRGPALLCSVINNSGTNLTAFAASATCPQATPGQAYFITDITAGSSVISSVTTDNYPVLKYGTGTNCGTGTTVIWAGYSLALTTIVQDFITPIRLPQNVDLCWMHAAGGSKTFVVSGYLGQ